MAKRTRDLPLPPLPLKLNHKPTPSPDAQRRKPSPKSKRRVSRRVEAAASSASLTEEKKPKSQVVSFPAVIPSQFEADSTMGDTDTMNEGAGTGDSKNKGEKAKGKKAAAEEELVPPAAKVAVIAGVKPNIGNQEDGATSKKNK
ncbi:hypothetical protein K435DRAFT_879723 [Dendrothele bispora CBS 962.96]|uniref:Uncharacterized protein n=1 Tax=Dendrothele bispora (strain CBS 962.96) TaxID=1314807 RepID=A0A4S8KKM8_DENBC|nr:hypothetical protein K435DRAFT_879723 [Dendrothele bispora CBS 962.96]